MKSHNSIQLKRKIEHLSSGQQHRLGL